MLGELTPSCKSNISQRCIHDATFKWHFVIKLLNIKNFLKTIHYYISFSLNLYYEKQFVKLCVFYYLSNFLILTWLVLNVGKSFQIKKKDSDSEQQELKYFKVINVNYKTIFSNLIHEIIQVISWIMSINLELTCFSLKFYFNTVNWTKFYNWRILITE